MEILFDIQKLTGFFLIIDFSLYLHELDTYAAKALGFAEFQI